jgi:tetratricopeptide (TPR) repeat protein
VPPDASALLLLGLPSLAAVALLAWDRRAESGTRTAVAYFAALAAYGALRGLAIRFVTGTVLDTPIPYLMNRPVATLFGVSLQEIVGWSVAVTLALRMAERLLPRAGAHGLAAASAIGLASTCLAVENAAIVSRWWTWTLAVPDHGVLRVPPVALLDWSFVAFDFLVPWLAFRSRAPWTARLASLLLFPLHMFGHTWFRALPGPFPVTGYDAVHVGIVAYVLWQAVSERPAGLPDSPAAPAWPALAAAALVVGACAVACVANGQAAAGLAALPLAALALVALARRPTGLVFRPWTNRVRLGARLGIAALALGFLALVSAPQTRGQQRLLEAMQRGAALANAGDLGGAEASLRGALRARPDHPGARTLLALVLLRQGRVGEARAEIDSALDAAPTSRDALLLGASLDLQLGARARGEQRAARGRRVYPDNAELAYLSLLARGEAGPGRPAADEAVTLARRAGPAALRALAALAERFRDAATVAACRAETERP